jgi:chemotaxis protein methyltransferase CheR
MTLCESGLLEGCDARILATDISTRILECARQGIYPASKVEPLPSGFGSRCFEPIHGSSPATCRIREHLRRMVTFNRMNLAEPPFPMQGPLDIILVRNVMIYFDNNVRKNLLDECRRLLRPGGYLLVGHAESLTGLAIGLKAVKPSIYVKAGS